MGEKRFVQNVPKKTDFFPRNVDIFGDMGKTKIFQSDLKKIHFIRNFDIIIIILARTPEIGQGLGRILSCGARKSEQT